MKTIIIAVQKEFCGECSLALLHFLRNMPGIESIEFEIGQVIVSYDETRLNEDQVREMVRENIERMGYRLQDNRGPA